MTLFRHVGLVVADLDRAQAFYCEVFGLKLYSRSTETGIYIDTLVGIPSVCLEWAKLGDDKGVCLELLRYYSHPDKSINAPVNRHGCSHIAFTVNNLQETLLRLRRFGGTAGDPVKNPENTVLVVYARDPEGIILELVQDL